MKKNIELNLSINQEMGKVKNSDLKAKNYLADEDILTLAEQYDSTNISGRLRLNDKNFYNNRRYFKENQVLNEHNGKISFAYMHQIQTAESIIKLPQGGLLADQVGMGKTIEAGMLIAELAYRDEWRTLIITLSNNELMNNWQDEMYKKFGLNLAKLDDENKDYKKIFENLKEYQETGVAKNLNGESYEFKDKVKLDYHGVIVPFEYLVDDRFISLIDEYNRTNKRQFHIDLIVVDESHRYTSNDSSKSENKMKALHKLQRFTPDINGNLKKQGRILLLTATPIKNDLNELLQLMQIIDPTKTEEDFREKLGLSKDDPFDLTTVINKEGGVNRWWNWFSDYGKRHTRIDTNYDPVKRKYGVHWKKKNSYSYYFNDDSKYSVRNYFEESDSPNTKIKVVYDASGKTFAYRSDKEYTPLKGIRKSYIMNYTSNISNIDNEKMNRLLILIKVLKKNISLSDFKNLIENGEYDLSLEGFTFEELETELDSARYETWRALNNDYDSMGNSKDDIESKIIIEKSIENFLKWYYYHGENDKFITSLLNYIKTVNPYQQKDKMGLNTIATYENLSILLCSKNMFLSLQKMITLGKIISMGEENYLQLNDGFYELYAGNSSINIDSITDEVKENDEIKYYDNKAYITNSKLQKNSGSISFSSNGQSKITIKCKSRLEKDKLVINDENGNEIASAAVKNKPSIVEIAINYNGKVELGFLNDTGYIYNINVLNNNDSVSNYCDFNSIDFKKHNREKIIIFCKDDSERRMLEKNQHLWDKNKRYKSLQSSMNEIEKSTGALSTSNISSNVVSIAYTEDAEGLNFQSCHTMINYSIVLSPLHMEQRVGRIDRIGQTHEMDVYFLADAQDVEGYILRFFEQELELFSNWSGDTTASTYIDAKELGENKKAEFDEFVINKWNVNTQNESLSYEDRILNFEMEISLAFKNVRERVNKIADYSSQISDMNVKHDEISEDDLYI